MNIAFSSAQDRHVEQMTAIYNHYVVNTAATFDDTLVTVENRRKWFFKYSYTGPHRIVVAERNEQAERLWHAVLHLPTRHREVIVLSHFENLSYKEIAEVLEIPIGTVMSRLYTARKHMAVVLDPPGVSNQGVQVAKEGER